jgi:lipid II:glycine glycyltransferase (peptidoglycan interpeptide bridge formation enzyme)
VKFQKKSQSFITTGRKVIRLGIFDAKKLTGGYQVFLHPIPRTQYSVVYFPRGPLPDKPMLNALKKLAQKENAIFVKMEPNVGGPLNHAPPAGRLGSEQAQKRKRLSSAHTQIRDFLANNGCLPGRSLFPPWTFWLDLKKSEEKLLSAMHSKTRYNLRLSQKHGVKVVEDNSDQAFKTHLKLLFETTQRQGFYAHTPEYHQKMWEILKPQQKNQGLTVHLLSAKYQKKTLVTWVLFDFNNVLYYPYGGSSREHREVMSSYAMMWEAIKFGKKMGCHTFDLWGTPGPEPSRKDPWYGFHRFKTGFGPQLVEFIGTYDLVVDFPKYRLFTLADTLRWKFLKLKAKLPI